MLACLSSAVFFIGSDSFSKQKIDFLIILGLVTWLVYTGDHIFDGYKSKGLSGEPRHDINYKQRKLLAPLAALFLTIIVWLAWRNRHTQFILNGVILLPVMITYIVLKVKNVMKPLTKMALVSVIVSAALVSMYNSSQFIIDLLTLERTSFALLIFLNQLVLEHFEFKKEPTTQAEEYKPEFDRLAYRIFFWISFILVLSTVLNRASWPFTLPLEIVAILLILILKYNHWFAQYRRYRFWADIVFVLLWPLSEIFLRLI